MSSLCSIRKFCSCETWICSEMKS